MRSVRAWLLARDPEWRAARRAARTAIVMPAVFALASQVIGNGTIATFAAFGSFAMLLFADFGGPLPERLAAQASLIAAGCVFITLATLASGNKWVGAASMFVVGFLVLFAGVASSVLATASTSVLLSFILPVATPAGAASIPDRLAGWLLAGAASLPAVVLLWPAPRREPLRDAAAEACRRLSERLSSEVAHRDDGSGAAVDEAVARSDAAVATLRARFLATPYRPSGLTTADRVVVRLVDEVVWLDVILHNAAAAPRKRPVDPTVRAAKAAAAVLLDHAGKSLGRVPPQDSLQDHLEDLARARRAMEVAAMNAVVLPPRDASAQELAGSLAPSFRAQELSFAVTAIAGNVEIATAAARRSWWQKALGRQPSGVSGRLASAQQRAMAHAEPHSVWLHNSVRGAIALAGAVLVADLSGAQHSFWIVLGALSVLRSNALSTGQNALRGLAGTAAGFVVGSALVLLLGTNRPLLWALLPVAIFVAGLAPALSFTAGQAGFTVALLILFNIISPAGWQVGLVRIEDVATGCAVSLVVGALFWPRGAAAALAQELSEAYAECSAYLRAVAETGAVVGSREMAELAASRATAAARRLDDAFREFLAERGRKQLTLSDVAALLTGVAGLRLTADAVGDLWLRDGSSQRTESPRAHLELIAATERVTNWYAAMAQAVTGSGPVPRPLPRDEGADGRLIEALRSDLEDSLGVDGHVKAHAVRLVWTSDHIDAARRLQESVEQPARSAARYRSRTGPSSWLGAAGPADGDQR